MNAPPGTVPDRTTTRHPRRPPAHKSVSLRHSPPAAKHPTSTKQSATTRHQLKSQGTALSSPNPPASDKANPPSSVSPGIINKQSSGESSDAGKWFENSNNHAANGSFVDNDPPFFLRNSSSSGTPPEGYEARQYPYQAMSMPYRPGLVHMGTDGSSTEDFRSVIDDLTVANKKLKQKLRRYEKLYDAHLQDEKLFEVRFHGLPDHKKKELEDTLRKFASNLGDASPGAELPSMAYPAPFDQQKTVSSTSRFAESGYASMSASGQNSSTAMSGQNSDRKMSKSQYSRQQQSIRSYLQDIPQGLMPRENVAMTDKSKKKLVVRRLEQVFAGKRSVPGMHQQQMQQEEVAQSAAMADRQEKEATGQSYRKEGLREARIMPVQTEDEEISIAQDALQKLRPSLAINEQDFAGSGSPDQRPTRPLDLDPFRAQVPAENMDYIRHLGFTPPDMESEEGPKDGHGWLYLNLLINMAQLHTINVTPDFVKEAVTDYSSKFELSHDGRKIRWKGGQNLSKNSDSCSEQLSGNSPYQNLNQSNSKSPSKRLKTGHSGASGDSSSIEPERQNYLMARAAKERDQNRFAYTPLFFHKDDSEDDDDLYNLEQSSSNSPFLGQPRGDSSGFGSSAMRSSSSRKRRENGPMIFYNKAKFCTDLSGDRRGVSVANATTYKSITSQPLGAGPGPRSASSHVFSTPEVRGPLDASPMDLDLDGGRQVSDEDLGFSPEALQSNMGEQSPELINFEASGLGGVQPDDNFSIKVRRSQSRVEPSTFPAKQPRPYSKRILAALNQQQSFTVRERRRLSHPIIKQELLSATRKSLPSSELPPASFLPFDSTSSGDVDSDLESNVSSGPSTTSSSDPNPVTALPLLNVSPSHLDNSTPASDESEVSSSKEDDSSESDGSIDMLAIARQLDPTTVRASEREYDADLADRLANDIPAGSSAATAGGGSGFNSPISDIGEGTEDERSTKRQSTASVSVSTSTRMRNLKRSRTSESLALHAESTPKKRSN